MKNIVASITMIIAVVLLGILGIVACTEQSSGNHEFGRDISSGAQYVFEGKLGVHAYQRAVVFTNPTGDSLVVRLKNPSPHQPPIGNIAGFYYDHRGQDKACGKPLEGEHMIFDDTYRQKTDRQGSHSVLSGQDAGNAERVRYSRVVGGRAE